MITYTESTYVKNAHPSFFDVKYKIQNKTDGKSNGEFLIPNPEFLGFYNIISTIDEGEERDRFFEKIENMSRENFYFFLREICATPSSFTLKLKLHQNEEFNPAVCAGNYILTEALFAISYLALFKHYFVIVTKPIAGLKTLMNIINLWLEFTEKSISYYVFPYDKNTNRSYAYNYPNSYVDTFREFNSHIIPQPSSIIKKEMQDYDLITLKQSDILLAYDICAQGLFVQTLQAMRDKDYLGKKFKSGIMDARNLKIKSKNPQFISQIPFATDYILEEFHNITDHYIQLVFELPDYVENETAQWKDHVVVFS